MSPRGAAEISAPSDDARAAVAPLLRHPASTAIVTDFDGTLAPIVEDPARARPLPGAADTLVELARRFGVAAVVSGRPASFLVDRLRGASGPGGDHGSRAPTLVGLYGLEWSSDAGGVVLAPDVEQWLSVVAGAADRLAAAAPPGVLVERKGATVTVHWREVPAAESWVTTEVEAEAARTGLDSFPGRRSLELRPPVAIDKGTVLRHLAEGATAACYFGDDLGDLPAFDVLDDLAARGTTTVAVAVVDEETPSELASRASLVVDGPSGALGLLRWLAAEATTDSAD